MRPDRLPLALALWLLLAAAAPQIAATQPGEAPASGGRFDALMRAQNAPASPGGMRPADLEPWRDDDAASVRLPVATFQRLWEQARRAAGVPAAGPSRASAPAVIYGSASYSGQATPQALLLTLQLRVTLDRPGRWKIVPLVGAGTVLRRARADGQPISVSRRSGYHAWITRRTGSVRLELDLVVPRRGPRGAIEYNFEVVRTPITRFSCAFPRAGLEPRLDAAITTAVKTEGARTLLQATLRPTTRIHIVGFKDLGDGPARRARVYAESMSLLSLQGRSQELFSVIRYTILYAGVRSFSVLLPGDVSVVSADGKGAFSYELERRADGTLLRGETAFPIRDSFEISLRLRRAQSHKRGRQIFDVPLPRCLGVERDAGWLAVEVPGKLRLREQRRERVVAVDVRQLPSELVRSAVSPILGAYRFHGTRRRLALATTRLPEQVAASSSIDRARAFSVVSGEGSVLTELRYTLRNRMRRSLALRMPAGARVRSVLLDGRPVKPSRDSAGRLVLPLSRSAGSAARLRGITAQVVFESQLGALSWVGQPELELPRVDLPISTLVWSVYLPARNLYSGLRSGGRDGEAQYHGQVSWRRPSDPGPAAGAGGAGAAGLTAAADGLASSGAGAMPVRIQLPKVGQRLDLTRYWIDQNQQVSARVGYFHRALVYPAVFLLGALLALALMLSLTWRGLPWRAAGAVVVAATLWPLQALAGVSAIMVAALLGVGLAALHRARWRRGLERLIDWGRSLPRRFRDRERPAERPTVGRQVTQWLLAGGLALAGLILLVNLLRVVGLLSRPLGG
jgi:hypothetical protein